MSKKAIFRLSRAKPFYPLAIFPEDAGTTNPILCLVARYRIVGGVETVAFGSENPKVLMDATRPATVEDCKPLLRMLGRILGPVETITRLPPDALAVRMAKAKNNPKNNG